MYSKDIQTYAIFYHIYIKCSKCVDILYYEDITYIIGEYLSQLYKQYEILDLDKKALTRILFTIDDEENMKLPLELLFRKINFSDSKFLKKCYWGDKIYKDYNSYVDNKIIDYTHYLSEASIEVLNECIKKWKFYYRFYIRLDIQYYKIKRKILDKYGDIHVKKNIKKLWISLRKRLRRSRLYVGNRFKSH